LFEGSLWMARETLDAESSGYFLLPDAPLAAGWNAVSAAEGSGVLGRCFDGTLNAEQITPTDLFAQICTTGQCCSRGMPGYRFHSYLANLNVTDEPLGYTPPRGPAVRFGLTYNHRDAFQPAAFSFANLGPKWTFDWMAWVTDIGNPR